MGAAIVVASLHAGAARASLLGGEALDAMANAVAWAALIIVPIVLITVFWLVHILPEKIAEKRRHPQLQAIKTLCLLSLFFGGVLWPLAWLWAYTKPVLHKMAYGTDVDEHDTDEALRPMKDAAEEVPLQPSDDVALLKRRIVSLEMQLAAASAQSNAGRPNDTQPPASDGAA